MSAPCVLAVYFHQIVQFPEHVCRAELMAFGSCAQLRSPGIVTEDGIWKTLWEIVLNGLFASAAGVDNVGQLLTLPACFPEVSGQAITAHKRAAL